MGGLGVNAVPIVGQPIAYGIGFVVLVIAGSVRVLSRYFSTFAHEGGHMLAILLTLRPLVGFTIDDNADAETTWLGGGAISTFLIRVVGYATPPWLGVAGAALIADGNPWAVLLAALVLSIAGVAASRNALAFTVPAIVVLGVGWLLIRGTPALSAAVAVGIVWLLLFNGAADALDFSGRKTDAALLAGQVVIIPAVAWELLWAVLAVIALIVGGQLLLRPGYLEL